MTKGLFYNTVLPDDADPRTLTEQDLLNLLELGDLVDWRPLLTILDADPHGQVAHRVEAILDLVESHGVAEFFRIKFDKFRGIPLDRPVTVAKPERFWGV